MNEPLPVMHIVRRFGCVGGMEKYVWELTHHLLPLGTDVEVICEEVIGHPDPRIIIHKVSKAKPKPRWKSMLEFRANVASHLLNQLDNRQIIIHSHERSIHHHVTTIHGPPMEPKPSYFGLNFPSRRIKAWKAMEHDELLGPSNPVILAVSDVVKRKLINLHSVSLGDKKITIAYPGVFNPELRSRRPEPRIPNNQKFLFVGKEWKRKGLPLAVKIVEQMPPELNACLDVYGPEIADLPIWIINHPCVKVTGWVEEIPWDNYCALIHPALNEPFGMIVPEARSHGLPVLTSSIVGSTELNFGGVKTVHPNATSSQWADELKQLIRNPSIREPEIKWTWDDLAAQHSNLIYPTIIQDIRQSQR